ncbi:zinc-binding alcohol dehydrogenase [Microbacterium faecale]|uniref:Zinc-binding alcohol dehydrogenase n=1 Tax=Microbacterium faecale TaxID=1804630 RepID=A0A916Y202_9MICO|nr:NAD(P)-dependent alcohol dehydrogenase [Microbacterium faecale]GGD26836.1 zinc-binding alcohol dehydrogenase [Microbacterium faecale]
MLTSAAIAVEPGQPLQIADITLDDPRDDEILVDVRATGICHTDMSAAAGRLGVQMPVVLGHEGAGVVVAVGSLITSVAPGDRVILAPDFCGRCDQCRTGFTTYCEKSRALIFAGTREDGSTKAHRDGAPVRAGFFGQSSFSRYALVTERNVLKVTTDAPWHELAALACGVSTGAASALLALDVRPAHSFTVFGVGTVGLAAIMAARMAGMRSIIAIDRHPERLELAKTLGATSTLNTDEASDIATALKDLTRGGTDRALDTTGVPALIASAVDALAIRGVCGFVAGMGAHIDIDLGPMLVKGAQLRGIMGGDATGLVFLADLVAAYEAGDYPIDRLITTYPLANINEAFADMASGRTVKPVITFADAG